MEIFYTHLNVFKAFLSAKTGEFAEANVDVGYITCGGDAPSGGQRGVMIQALPERLSVRDDCTPSLATALSAERNTNTFRAPAVSPSRMSPMGETMSVKESLAIHAQERDRAIAEFNASPACLAEVRRRSAINSYIECRRPLQPNEPDRTCRRPW